MSGKPEHSRRQLISHEAGREASRSGACNAVHVTCDTAPGREESGWNCAGNTALSGVMNLDPEARAADYVQLEGKSLRVVGGRALSIQTKLEVGAANDPLEDEADRVAEAVMRMPDPYAALAGDRVDDLVGSTGEVRGFHGTELQVDRQYALPVRSGPARASSVRRDANPTIALRVEADNDAFPVDGELEGQIQDARGGGMPLDGEYRTFMESRFGTDFSGVRLHTDGRAAQLSRSLNAHAFTVGRDIFFGAGKYEPGSDNGKRLLAHELTHIVQQGGTSGLQDKDTHGGLQANRNVPYTEKTSISRKELDSVTDNSDPLTQKDNGKTKESDSDKKEEKPKYPSWKDDTVTFPLPENLGGNLSINCGENPGAALAFEGKASHKFFDFKKTWNVPVGPPGVMLDINAAASSSLTAKALGKVSGTWNDAPGPFLEPTKMLTLNASGGGSLGASLEGSLGIGAAVGVPYCNIAAGAKASLEAKASIGATLSGTAERWPEGDWSGIIMFNVSGKATVEATGELYLDMVLPTDRYNLYTYTLGTRKLGELSISCDCGVDLESGLVINPAPKIVSKWDPFPEPQLSGKRALTPEERAEFLPVSQGGSGAPPSLDDLPSEAPEDGGDGSGGGRG